MGRCRKTVGARCLLLLPLEGCSSHSLRRANEVLGGLEVEEVQILQIVILGRLENVQRNTRSDSGFFIDCMEEIEEELGYSKQSRMVRYWTKIQTWSHLNTMSNSCCVRGFCWLGLSLRGGTNRLSRVASTSFQSRDITMTMALSVSVSFMSAKLSLK